MIFSQTLKAPLTVIADGAFSNFRKQFSTLNDEILTKPSSYFLGMRIKKTSDFKDNHTEGFWYWVVEQLFISIYFDLRIRKLIQFKYLLIYLRIYIFCLFLYSVAFMYNNSISIIFLSIFVTCEVTKPP